MQPALTTSAANPGSSIRAESNTGARLEFQITRHANTRDRGWYPPRHCSRPAAGAAPVLFEPGTR